jgi:hypothetical protein
MNVILVGTDAALLEGLAQSFAAHGFKPHVVGSLVDACELAIEARPIVALVERDLAMASPGEAMSIHLASGGSLALFHGGDSAGMTPIRLQRSVVAELILPLERARLVALAKSLAGRAEVVGKVRKVSTVDETQHRWSPDERMP